MARRIVSFVEHGGVVIADCVPNADAFKQPLKVMEDLFGVTRAKTGRVRRTGHWVPQVTGGPYWTMRPAKPPDESKAATDAVHGAALGQPLDLTLISPRPATVTGGDVLLKTAAGLPAIVGHSVGKGRVFLLGFCCQDTYFNTWQPDKPAAREQLAGLLYRMTEAAGVQAHVRSSNVDIEASVRTNEREGFLFVINHEAAAPETTVRLADLGFAIGQVVDLAGGQAVRFTEQKGGVELSLSVPLGQTRLLHMLGK